MIASSVPTLRCHILPMGAGISGSWTSFGWLQDVLFTPPKKTKKTHYNYFVLLIENYHELS